MQFRDFAENLLGSKVKIKLIRHLLSDEAITSERELAKLIGVSPGAVNQTLKEFHEANLVSPLRIGAATAWQLNKKSYAYDLLKNFEKGICFNPFEELKAVIRICIQNGSVTLPPKEFGFVSAAQSYLLGKNIISSSDNQPILAVKKAIIFGSLAMRTELPNSDIDLFLLVDNERSRESVNESFATIKTGLVQRYGNMLTLNIFTPKDFKDPKNKKFLENISKGMVVFEK